MNADSTSEANPRDGRYISPEALEKLRTVIISLFSQGLFHEVGFRAICSQARVSPKTVYKYFGNKEQLLAACVEQDLQELAERAAQVPGGDISPREQIRFQISTLFEFYESRPDIARMIFLNIPVAYWISGRSPAHSAHRNNMLQLISEGQAQGLVRADLDVAVLAELVSGGLNRLVSQWLTQGEWQLTQHIDTCTDFYWSAVKA